MNQGSRQPQDIVVPAAVLIITYFFINTILTSVAISWAVEESVFKFWAKTCIPLAVDYSLSALAATIIVSLSAINEFVPLLVAPLIGVVWAWQRINKVRVAESQKNIEKQEQLYRRTVESLALAVDAKDQTTYGHIRRVRAYATGLARLCGIKNKDELNAIEYASLLHDIGKIAIDDYILNKPGRLSKEEFEKIKIHAAAGDEILQQVHFPFPVAKYVRSHHERWDGNGYPDGLKGENIPLGARILAVADTFDAIRFSRPYKQSMTTDEAIEILRSQSNSAYDPKLVQLFIDNLEELEATAVRESKNTPELSFRKFFERSDQDLSIQPANPVIQRDFPAELVQLAEFCSTISGYLDLNDILPVFSHRMQRLVPFSTCAFYLRTGNNRVFAAHTRGMFSELIKGHSIEMGKGISGWVAAHKRPMINAEPALDLLGIQGDFSFLTDALVVPIAHEDEILGTITLYAQDPISYGEHDLDTLQMLATLLAPLIAESKKGETAASEHAVDPITRIHRISYLTAIGPQLISFANKNKTPLSLIYFEISNLPKITRIFGSQIVDSVLSKIASYIRSEIRESDILVRYGHQGFVALMPGVRNDQALRCIERLKLQISREFVDIAQRFSVDLKAGAAFYPKDGATVFGLLQSAQESIRSEASEDGSSDANILDFIPRI